MTQPMQWPTTEVTVWYDCRGFRKKKVFKNPLEARSFYVWKFKEGKNPKIEAKKE